MKLRMESGLGKSSVRPAAVLPILLLLLAFVIAGTSRWTLTGLFEPVIFRLIPIFAALLITSWFVLREVNWLNQMRTEGLMKFEKGELLHGGTLAAILSGIVIDAVNPERWSAEAIPEWIYRPLDEEFAPIRRFSIQIPTGPGTHLYSEVEIVGDMGEGEGTGEGKPIPARLLPLRLQGVSSWKTLTTSTATAGN